MGVTNSYYYYDDDDIKSFSRVGILDLQFGSTTDMLVCKASIQIACCQNIYLSWFWNIDVC